jgi:ABC-2 type transport system permease protein
MSGSVAAELLVLRKRAAAWILLAIWIALAMFFAYLLPYVTYSNNSGGRTASLTDLLPQRLVGNLIGGFPFYGGAIALMLGVLIVGSEYGWGTFKTLFTQRPGRLQIFAGKLAALGVALVPFVVLVFAFGAVASSIIALREGAAVSWPSAWLLVRALLAGWFILAVWAAFGVLLALLTRGTALAIGIGILYTLVIEGLLSAFAREVSLLKPVVDFFLRANAYSLTRGLGASVEAVASNGPGSFAGPFVGGGQALLVLIAYIAGFVLLSALLLRRRDVA